MDHQQLRTLVFEKTGIKVDSNDPIFALVALNETVLAEAVEQHVALIDDATARLDALLRQFPGGATLPAAAHLAPASQRLDWRLLAGAAAVALASALLVLGGQALFGHGTPVPAAIPTAPTPASASTATLTPEQSALLQTGEKFNRVLKRLDEPTRAKLQAEMRKP
jgi:hypothetical protein